MRKNLLRWQKRKWNTSVGSTTDLSPLWKSERMLLACSCREGFSKSTAVLPYSVAARKPLFNTRSELTSLPISMVRHNHLSCFTLVFRDTSNFRKDSQFWRSTFQGDSPTPGCVHSRRG